MWKNSSTFDLIRQHGEENGYKGNLLPKKLLWHGTKTENVASILSRGLEVAPPSSESTGAHFGQGIYFTNSSSKAASYCGARRKQRTYEGIMLLCEVALGHMAQFYTAQNMCPLPTQFNSVWGVGHFAPDQNVKTILWNDVEVPYGPIINRANTDTDLAHDEFVVYDSKQIKIRYLVHVNFEYNDYYD
ncbi:poly [ADP-ribose] polymerase 1-like [Cotesia glomerata]|uniref:poly [ADP-ribose] polymerase 1-like n=1 Tax=Cotesia glomerata TaxID=32391 RepID=UPI001D00A3DE|nr:poly [ADP-ribose] polymerase 1-like [Cotesia glomerata]